MIRKKTTSPKAGKPRGAACRNQPSPTMSRAKRNSRVDELQHQNRELRETQELLEKSRDRYADLYDFAPVGYVDLDARGRIRSINLTGAAMLSVPRASLAGKFFTHFVSPGDRAAFLGHLKRCWQKGGKSTTEVTLVPRDGLPYPVQLHSVMAEGRKEGGVACRTVITDIRERKQAEDALRESEERVRSLLKETPVGIVLVQDGSIVFMNAAQEEIFGPILVSRKIVDFGFLHPEERERFLTLCGVPRRAGVPSDAVEIRILLSPEEGTAGGVRWVHCRSSRVVWHGREAVLVSMIDITRTKELEQIALVQEKMASLGHVAAGIAHEIRNPLSGINIYAAAVDNLCRRSEGLAPEEKETIRASLGQLLSASNKIASVIQRVMDFSKPVPPRLEPGDLNRAVEGALELALVTVRKHGVELTTSLSADLPKCRADLRLVEQVVLNLISNALQAMEGVEGPKKLEIRTSTQDRKVIVRVSDSGPGIAPCVRERVFEPFFTTRKEGHGIGLSFSHRVITDHGGTLTVGTSRWGGAEFRIEIPVDGKGAGA